MSRSSSCTRSHRTRFDSDAGMSPPRARRIRDLATLTWFVAVMGAAAPDSVKAQDSASPPDTAEPASHEFFEAMGLSMNMCEPLAKERALELGFQPRRPPANAPKEASYFSHPDVRRAGISFRTQEDEGGLELADMSIFASNTLSREEIAGEVDRIEALYGPGACRERTVNITCRGIRHAGPYEISLRAQYDAEWVRYTFRNRFQMNRFFERSPVCIDSPATASAPAESSTRPETRPGARSGTETSDSQPTTGRPGLPSEPAGSESRAETSPTDPQRPTSSDSPPSNAQPGQKLFESAQALEEQAYAEGSPELHARAAELYEQAAALGHPQAMFNLSRKHARGEGVEQSPETELDLLERAAQAGLAHAQYNLALKYASGSGVAESQETATELLEAAAEAGDAEAQLALAKRKLAGRGTAQSDQEAIALLESAAAGGSAEAQYLLGRIFEDGVLAPRDAQRSEEYFCIAAATGYKPAVDKCGRSFLPPNDTAKLGGQIRY